MYWYLFEATAKFNPRAKIFSLFTVSILLLTFLTTLLQSRDGLLRQEMTLSNFCFHLVLVVSDVSSAALEHHSMIRGHFTKVPVAEVFDAISALLAKDDSFKDLTAIPARDICSLTELCLCSTYRSVPGKRPCTSFQGINVAASIQMYGNNVPGKRPCGPKSWCMFKCPWALNQDTTVRTSTSKTRSLSRLMEWLWDHHSPQSLPTYTWKLSTSKLWI